MSIALFGGLKIRLDGRDLTGLLPGRQGRALIAHLTLNRHRSISRDELLDVLWPERPPASPEAALSSVLAKVRRALEPATIDGRHALTLRLPEGAQIDVETLDAQIERAERALADADATTALASAQAALALLAQPLLPDLDGAWIEPWRERFGDLTPRALDTAARAGIALGARRLPSAERAAASLVKLEPFREGGYALLMRAQAEQGNAAEALRTFEQLRSLLRDELGASPSAPLIALHESLLRAQEQAPGVPPIAAQTTDRVLPAATVQMIGGAFVGRDEHVQRLRARWASCHPGPSQLVLLVGEAGVGKSRLAAEFADEVHANGGTVLYGRADEEALLPHQSFVEALRHLITHADSTLLAALEPDRDILSRLLPDLAAGAPERDAGAHGAEDTMRYRLFEAVATLLCAATSRSPVLLILDDLDWADKPTHLLLRHLFRHPLLTGLLVIGTVRHRSLGSEHALVDLVTDLRRERRYDRLTLPGLDEAATRALVADRLGRDVTPDFVRRLGEQTEGNAFFIEETIRALIEQGLASGEIVTATSLERIGVPEGVAQIVGRRIRHLSPLAQEALTAASVVGRHFRLAVVARLIDVAPERVMGALEESMASGLVLELSDSVDVFSFSHALVREALYGSLSVSRRVRLHHGVADALEGLARSADINPAELAHHFLLARHFAGAGPARRYSIAAGDRATQLLAYEEAVAHYTQAAALFDDDEAARCEVLLALGRAQWRAGHDSARDTFRTAADSAVRRRDRDQLARAALGHSARYHESEYAGPSSHELLDAAIAAVGDGDSPRRVLLLSRLAGNLAFAAEQRDRAAQVSAEGLAMARRLGDENLVLAALMARHATRLDVCHLDERLALSEEFIGLCPGHREMLVERCHWRLYDLLEHGDVDGALAEQPRLEGARAGVAPAAVAQRGAGLARAVGRDGRRRRARRALRRGMPALRPASRPEGCGEHMGRQAGDAPPPPRPARRAVLRGATARSRRRAQDRLAQRARADPRRNRRRGGGPGDPPRRAGRVRRRAAPVLAHEHRDAQRAVRPIAGRRRRRAALRGAAAVRALQRRRRLLVVLGTGGAVARPARRHRRRRAAGRATRARGAGAHTGDAGPAAHGRAREPRHANSRLVTALGAAPCCRCAQAPSQSGAQGGSIVR